MKARCNASACAKWGRKPAAALGWMLQKGDGIVPIPGTTKLSHLEENIRAANLAVSPEEWKELEDALSRVEIVGDRYPAEQQRQVQKS